MTRDSKALQALDDRPRTLLAHLPTPLQEAVHLRRALSEEGSVPAPPILLKRDDETGCGLGGNKVRKLEYELAPDRREGITHVITTGGPQSNHARITAAAAASLGLSSILVLNGEAGDPPRGNALLHRLFGAEIRTVFSREERDPAMAEAARKVEKAGGRALVIPLGASTPLGALGYVRAARELTGQLPPPEAETVERTWIFLASSSCGTLGGLAAGFTLLGRDDIRLVGVSADVSRSELVTGSERLAREAMALLGSHRSVPDGLVDGTDEEVGDGYGVPTSASDEAKDLLARSQGVVLDPFYTAKAAAGALRSIRQGRVGSRERLVFWHTGGHPALLA